MDTQKQYTKKEFADLIRLKYPKGVASSGVSYAEMDDNELADKVVAKYPTYQSWIKEEGLLTQSVNAFTGMVGEKVQGVKDFVSGIGETIQKRGQSAGREIQRAEAGEISGLKAGLRTLGEGAGAVQDIGFSAASTYFKTFAPEWIQEKFGDIAGGAIEQVAESDIAQKGMESYENWKQAHPEAAKDLGAFINIASILPAGAPAKSLELAGKGVGKFAQLSGIAKVTDKTIEWGGKVKNKIPIVNKMGAVGSVDEVVKSADDLVKNLDTMPDGALKEATKGLAEAKSRSKGLTFEERLVGMNESVKNRISGKVELFDEYSAVVNTRNADDTVLSGLGYASTKLDDAQKVMEGMLDETGGQIGALRKKLATYTATPDQVANITEGFTKELSKLNLEVGPRGTIRPIAGKIAKTATANDQKVLQDLYKELLTMKQSPDLENLIDLRNVFDRKINFAKEAREVSNSVDPLSRKVRKAIAEVGEKIVGKEGAADLARYSDYMDAYETIADVTRRKTGSEFLLKQVLSERNRPNLKIIETIKEHTGIDLLDHATMAAVTTDLFGNSDQFGVLKKEIEKAGLSVARVLRGDKSELMKAGLEKVKSKVVDPAKVYRKAAEGK